MDLKEAKYMLAISHYKSINKAAKALYISQPSLSKYLQNLEYRLNGKLFSRIQNEYVPTYMGKRYLTYANRITACEGEWEAEYQDIMNLKKGCLNITIPMSRSSLIIPSTILRFHERYPQIDVNILEDAHSIETAILNDSNIDLAIYNVNCYPKSLDFQLLGISEIVLVVPNEHWIVKTARRKPDFLYPWVDLHALSKEPFILLHPGQTTGQLIQQLFEQQNFKPLVWLQTRNSEVAIQLALKGMGLTITAQSYVQQIDSAKNGICLSIGDKPLQTSMIGAYRKGQYLPEYVQEYLNLVKEHIDMEP